MQSIMESIPSNWSSTVHSFTDRSLANLVIFGSKVTDHLKMTLPDFELPEVEEWCSVEGIVTATLIFVVIACAFIISLNIYRKIRYSIPATVNCWFCNVNSKVLYSLRDTWTCPKCQQYNGFTADGNYNKRIPAQFIEALNRPIRGCPPKGYQPVKSGANSNGLCSQCNLNQVLKVFQLASFVPVNEKNFDAEVEAEQKRLEQLYDICSQCKVIVEETLKQAPEKRQSPIKQKAKVNKVIPNPSIDSANNCNAGIKSSQMFYEYQKDISDGSDCESSSRDSFLSLDNLKISKNKNGNRSFEDFNRPMPSTSPRMTTSPQTSTHACYSPMYNRNPHYGPAIPHSKEMPSLWKDYPMVQTGMSPTYSLYDTMSCPVGRHPYVNYNAVMVSPNPAPNQFSYQSSNVGVVFGGRKPLISPPKFSSGNQHFTPYVRYGAYYDVSSSPVGGSPIMLNPQFFSNPISRSSSQSSGFVSQQGGLTTPPPASTSNGLYR